jgi:hypothetical protein
MAGTTDCAKSLRKWQKLIAPSRVNNVAPAFCRLKTI